MRAYYHLVLFRITQPYVVVVILIAAVVCPDVLGGSHIGLIQIFFLPGQTAPAERTIAIVKQEGAEDIFHIGGEYEAVQVILAVLANLLGRHAGVVHRLQECIAIVEEIGSLLVKFADHLIVMLQGLVNQLGEAFGVLVQHLSTLFEGQSLRAVSAVVRHVAGGLVAH